MNIRSWGCGANSVPLLDLQSHAKRGYQPARIGLRAPGGER